MAEEPDDGEVEQKYDQAGQALKSETVANEGDGGEIVFNVKQIDLNTKKYESQKRLAGHNAMVENGPMTAHRDFRHPCSQPFEDLPVNQTENKKESNARGKG